MSSLREKVIAKFTNGVGYNDNDVQAVMEQALAWCKANPNTSIRVFAAELGL